MSEAPAGNGTAPAPPPLSPSRAARWPARFILGLVAASLVFAVCARVKRLKEEQDFRALLRDGCQTALKIRSEIGAPFYREWRNAEGELEIWKRALKKAQDEDPRIINISILTSSEPTRFPDGLLATAAQRSAEWRTWSLQEGLPLEQEFLHERIVAWKGCYPPGPEGRQPAVFIMAPAEKTEEVLWGVYLVMRAD